MVLVQLGVFDEELFSVRPSHFGPLNLSTGAQSEVNSVGGLRAVRIASYNLVNSGAAAKLQRYTRSDW